MEVGGAVVLVASAAPGLVDVGAAVAAAGAGAGVGVVVDVEAEAGAAFGSSFFKA